jgi:C1A family cysteine protease
MTRMSYARITISALALVFLFVCMLLSTATAGLNPEQARELSEIQRAIRDKWANWKAGETSVSKLSPAVRKKLCGLLFSQRQNMEIGEQDSPSENIAAEADLTFPPVFDWRNYHYTVVTPVKDQMQCGSCWAFAAVGAMESALLINDTTLFPDIDLSEQFLVSCDDENYACCGGYLDKAYDFLTSKGTVTESCSPYKSGGCTCYGPFCYSDSPSCPDQCDDGIEPGHIRITGWEWVNKGKNSKRDNIVDAIKVALLDGPVPCGMEVYTDFFYYSGGVYEHTWGTCEGGHAVIIIGWDDADEYWIVKNSWGTDWGEDGYFRIKWGNCKIGVDAGRLLYSPCDQDGDGYKNTACGGVDCDDTNADINPGAVDYCYDGLDSDCEGSENNCCLSRGAKCIANEECCSGNCDTKSGRCK